MKLIRLCAMAALIAVGLAITLFAQDAGNGAVVPMAGSKFVTPEGLPACSSLSTPYGDPFKGPSTILIKMKSSCLIPWHWHTASESLMIVSGKGKIEMKGEAAHNLSAGDFVYLPGKHVHQFTCTATCTFFNRIEGVFDLHYVDKDGKEITPADALKSGAKPKAAAASKAKK